MSTTNGFRGEIGELSLPDIIQIKGHSLFTGSIFVEYQNKQGEIFLLDGEINHATLGDISGEDAFFQIIKWPGGGFSVQPGKISTLHTIHNRTTFLLLDAFSRLDEERAGIRNESAPAPAKANANRNMSKVASMLVELNGVDYAVLVDKTGNPQQDSTVEASQLAAKSFFLATSANRLGMLMGMGEVRALSMQGVDSQLLLYNSQQNYLGIAVNPQANIETVEKDIKTVLAPANKG